MAVFGAQIAAEKAEREWGHGQHLTEETILCDHAILWSAAGGAAGVSVFRGRWESDDFTIKGVVR